MTNQDYFVCQKIKRSSIGWGLIMMAWRLSRKDLAVGSWQLAIDSRQSAVGSQQTLNSRFTIHDSSSEGISVRTRSRQMKKPGKIMNNALMRFMSTWIIL